MNDNRCGTCKFWGTGGDIPGGEYRPSTGKYRECAAVVHDKKNFTDEYNDNDCDLLMIAEEDVVELRNILDEPGLGRGRGQVLDIYPAQKELSRHGGKGRARREDLSDGLKIEILHLGARRTDDAGHHGIIDGLELREVRRLGRVQ